MPVYKNKNGTYYIRVYVKKFGRSRQISRRGFKTKKEAQKEILLLNLDNNDVQIDMTFNQLYNKYYEYYCLKNKWQSCRRIKSYFENHILPYFKDMKVRKITSDDYMEWQKLILQKNLCDSFKKGLHGVMVTILNYAMKNYGLEKNIAHDMGGFKKQNIKTKMNWWNYQEYELFMKNITDIKDRALFALLYETGARFGEIAALKWIDYDYEFIYINKTISKEKNKNDEYMINSPKTYSSNRKIKLSNNVINILNELKDYNNEYIGFNDNWYIVGGIKPYSHTTATAHKNMYCKIANVKQIKLHEFRHSHVSLLINKGVPITNISARLGHSDSSITLSIYSHMLMSDNDPAVDVLNELNSK